VPKISKEQMQKSQLRIRGAALKLFTTKGFHGTNIRDIAKETGMSTGGIYTHYSSKEAMFTELAQRYRADVAKWLEQTVRELQDPFSRAGLMALASAIRAKVRANPEYLQLIFIDVVEFKNRHFARTFMNVPAQFRKLLGPTLDQVKRQPGWRGGDPAFVLAAIYLYFFNYFVTEKFVLGRRYLGVSDESATSGFIDLILHGLWHGATGRNHSGAEAQPAPTEQKALFQTARQQVDLIRLLAGRLLNPPEDGFADSARRRDQKRPDRQPILFEPRITREGIDENRLRIEAAALELFTTQGFHGTNILEIAEKAGISGGGIYTYYSSKESIFEELVHSYRSSLRRFRNGILSRLRAPFSRTEVTLLAAAMESMVYDDAEYYLLMFIDVLEFKSRYFADTFHDLPGQFRRRLGPVFRAVAKEPLWCGQDPAFVFATIYTLFFSYFMAERLMYRRHLGVSDEEALERMIDLLCFGLWAPEKRSKPSYH
jgi:AcrR family transcriptional regulator